MEFSYPEFGFKAKHFNFLEANQIKYSSVATWLPNCILTGDAKGHSP
jgi:hypothetical protein